jgi:arylsulfatase A-like enzyme
LLRRGLALVLLAAAAGGCWLGDPEPARGPRLLLVTIDTLRADHVGSYGGAIPTPTLDRLGRDGAVLLDACTPTPSTGPAHASLWTGLHPWRHGVLDNAVPLAAGVPTVAEAARTAGIATGAFVSSYVLHERFGLGRGFETYHFEPSETYAWRGRQRGAFWTRGARTTDAAIEWLRRHRDQPFLLWVHYFDPHAPYEAPPGFERPPSERVPVAGKSLPPGVPSFARLADLIRGYRGEVVYVDAELARLVAALRDLGLLDATAVVVTSDHGEGLGDHGLLEHGENLFDELVRVPLVVRAPGIARGQRLGGAVQLEDVAPTALELLGLPAPAGLDGRSLAPWLRGEASGSPRAAALGRRKPYRGRPDLFYVRSDGRKWIGSLGAVGTSYRLADDPREARGELAPAPEALASAADSPAPEAAGPLDPETRQALQALG